MRSSPDIDIAIDWKMVRVFIGYKNLIVRSSRWFFLYRDQFVQSSFQIVVARMRSSPDIDIANDWKMVTVFIGANDLCSASCLNPVSWSPAAHAKKLSIALDYLHKHLPRTIVNLVPVLGKLTRF